MDLNLYLGLSPSGLPNSLAELGSDLALVSHPLLSSSTEVSPPPATMLEAVESSDSRAPNSPSRSSDSLNPPSDVPLHPTDGGPVPKYTSNYGPSNLPMLPIMQEREEPDAPYSPSSVEALPIVEHTEEPRVENEDPRVPYDPVSPSRLVDRGSPRISESHIPYSPIDVPLALTPQAFGDVDFTMQWLDPEQDGELLRQDDGSSSLGDLLSSPEFRFRRLIETNHRWWRNRRFRASLPQDSERSDPDRPISPIAGQPVHDIMSSQREFDSSGECGMTVNFIKADGSNEEMKEKSRQMANFECNICLDLAIEPVVTSCGHMFCWPCLYQWLYLHCEHKECPVCKGEISESNITPIYGRGSSESIDEKKAGENEESGLKIPPRPRGNRYESLRQQLRPISRRLSEGIATSWRRLVDERMHNQNLFGDGEPIPPGINDGWYRTPLTRMRARRMQREEGIPISGANTSDIGLRRDNTPISQNSNSSLLFRGGADLWTRLSLQGLASSERLAAISADLGRAVGRFASSSNGYATPSSTVNHLAPDLLIGRTAAPAVPATLAADQASASSTMAIIQGDVAAPDASVEPNSVGSSRSHRRRGRSSTSSSLDVDGGALHPHKRRRLN